MPDNPTRLRSLVELAKEPSSDRRRDLLREITDLFVDASDTYNEREKDHFNAIMMGVTSAMEAKVRLELAHKLANVEDAPRGVITMLANDSIEVALPVLQNSSVLEDIDLLEVVRRHGQGHMRAISGRKDVSAQVVDALIQKGDDDVLKTLVRNDGAKISNGSMERIVSRAEHNQQLHAPLVERTEMPPELLNEMFWFVSSNLRQHIVERTAAIDSDTVDRLIAESQSSVVAEMAAQQANMTEAERFILNKQRLGQLDDDLLIELLKARQFREFIYGLAYFVDVDVRTAQRVFYDPGCEALAIACKAKNVSQQAFAVLLAHTKKQGGSKDVDSVELLELYAQLTPDAARRTMRFWRVREQSAGDKSPSPLKSASA
ncbi:MAG: DUF2336 domain-containing protein [Alphaproteobacteria bacterium]